MSVSETMLREVEALVWELRKVPGNMLITHSQGLNAAVASGRASRVQGVLSQIEKTLENQYSKTGHPIPYTPYEFLDRSLVAAIDLDPVGVSKVRGMLSELVITPAPEEA